MINFTEECFYNSSHCYFIDPSNTCLSDETVLDLIERYVVPTYYEWIGIVLYVIVFLVGTIGNLLVIIVIQRHRSMRTVTNMFIMNLAAADLLVLVFCLPATVIQDVTKTWFFGLILCKFINYIQNMSVSVSVLTLMAISIERYQAIVHPLKFSGTKQRARIFILSVWILSLLLVFPDVIMMTLSRQFGDRLPTIYLTYCQWDAHPLFDLLYQFHISLCLFVIPLGLMVFTYSGIARVLWGSLPTERMFYFEKRSNIGFYNPSSYSGKRRSSDGQDETSTGGSTLINSTKSATVTVQENRQKAAKMLISVVVIFAICYIPVHVFNLFRYIYVYLEYFHQAYETSVSSCFQPRQVSLQRTGTTKLVTISALISHFLPYFNSSINPIIYNIMSDRFRLKFRGLFARCCCSKELHSTPSTSMMMKSSSVFQHSPMSNSNTARYSSIRRETLNVIGNQTRLTTNVNNHQVRRQAALDSYTSPTTTMSFRLTNL